MVRYAVYYSDGNIEWKSNCIHGYFNYNRAKQEFYEMKEIHNYVRLSKITHEIILQE